MFPASSRPGAGQPFPEGSGGARQPKLQEYLIIPEKEKQDKAPAGRGIGRSHRKSRGEWGKFCAA